MVIDHNRVDSPPGLALQQGYFLARVCAAIDDDEQLWPVPVNTLAQGAARETVTILEAVGNERAQQLPICPGGFQEIQHQSHRAHTVAVEVPKDRHPFVTRYGCLYPLCGH